MTKSRRRRGGTIRHNHVKEAKCAHEYGDHEGHQDHGDNNHKEDAGWDLSANDTQKQEEAGQDPGNNNEQEEAGQDQATTMNTMSTRSPG